MGRNLSEKVEESHIAFLRQTFQVPEISVDCEVFLYASVSHAVEERVVLTGKHSA